MKINKFAFINNNEENQNNNLHHKLLNKKSDKPKKKKVRKFIRIKRKFKENNNIKRIKKNKKIKTVPKDKKNNITPESPIFLSKESLNIIFDGNTGNSDSLKEEERFDPERSRIDLLRSNNDNNKIIIEGNYDSDENTLFLRNETIFIGLSLNSKSLVPKKL